MRAKDSLRSPRPSFGSILLPVLPVLLVANLDGQTVRPEQIVDLSAEVDNRPSVASVGELSAVAYSVRTTGDVYVVTSDGSGVSWSSPTKINATPGAPTGSFGVDFWSTHIVGDQVFVGWRASPPGTPSIPCTAICETGSRSSSGRTPRETGTT